MKYLLAFFALVSSVFAQGPVKINFEDLTTTTTISSTDHVILNRKVSLGPPAIYGNRIINFGLVGPFLTGLNATELTSGTIPDARLSANVSLLGSSIDFPTEVSNKPNTLAGYGIVDPIVLTSGSYANPAWLTALAWSKLTGIPSTLAGYGITDPIVLTSGTYANPAWITALAFSKVTGVPSYELALGNPVSNGLVLSSMTDGTRSWRSVGIGDMLTTTYDPDTNGIIGLAQGGTNSSTAAGARTNLGLAIGTNVEAWSANLDTWSAKTPPTGTAIGSNDPQTLTNKSIAYSANTITGVEPFLGNPGTNGFVLSSTTAGVRSWIATGSADMLTSTYDPDLNGIFAIAQGGTGASSAATARSNLGVEPALGNPATSGFVLSSTTAGVRSWISVGTGSGDMLAATYDPDANGIIGIAQGGTNANNATSARANLGVIIGSDVQAFDPDLASIAALSTTAFGRGLLTEVSAATSRSTLGVEPALGNPSTTGFVLSSTSSGTRSWIAPAAGGSSAVTIPPIRSQQIFGLLPILPVAATTVANTSAYDAFPSVITDNLGRIHCFYREGTLHVSYDGILKHAVSANGGATWTTTTIAHGITGNQIDTHAIRLASGRILIAFTIEVAAAPHLGTLYSIYSDDNGNTWSTPSTIAASWSGADSAGPYVTVILQHNGELIIAVYGKQNIGDAFWRSAIMRSVDGGVTWGSRIALIGTGADGNYNEVGLFYYGETLVALVRREDSTSVLTRLTSSDNGITWSAPTTPTPPTGWLASLPDTVVIGNATHMYYRLTSSQEPARSVSYDGGITWSSNEVLTGLGTFQYSSTIYVDPGLLISVIAVQQSSSDCDLILRTYRAGAAIGLDDTLASDRVYTAAISNSSAGGSVAVLRPTTTNATEAYQVLTDATTVNWNGDLGGVAKVTLAGNRTLGDISNAREGAIYTLKVVQDATGSRTLAYDANYVFPGGTATVLTTTASKADFLRFLRIDGKNHLLQTSLNHASSGGGGGGGSATPEILWWKMNDGTGIVVAATVGTVGETNATWITGESGSGFALSMASKYLATEPGNATYSSNILTVTFWMKPTDITTAQNVYENDSNWITGCFLAQLGGGGLSIAMKGTGTTAADARIETATAPPTGTWVHVAVVMDNSTAAGDIKIYYDGVLQTTTVDQNNKSTILTFPVGKFWFGTRAGTSIFYQGAVDDVRIYNHELTGVEILAVKNDPQ